VECRKYEQLHPQNQVSLLVYQLYVICLSLYNELADLYFKQISYVICLSLYNKLADLYFKQRHIM
jgi:hypothetical protein